MDYVSKFMNLEIAFQIKLLITIIASEGFHELMNPLVLTEEVFICIYLVISAATAQCGTVCDCRWVCIGQVSPIFMATPIKDSDCVNCLCFLFA